ncbi:MAG TPA: hypothetical protein VMM12_18525 [Longimicrobiales bacterium]|nr:hypothetical protein [Longimicrobiales bacterium]
MSTGRPRTPRILRRRALFPLLLFCLADSGCASSAEPAHPQTAFLTSLARHCGRAYAGRIIQRPAGDRLFRGDERLVVHFRECSDDQLKLPFHVEANRSRTWILTRTDSGIDLRHDHRHADGSPDETTMYGAHTRTEGAAARQEFLRPRGPDGVVSGWAIEIVPGQRYTYGTIRDGEWRYRLDFDLTTPIEAPPPPWGHR